jgi:CheY-like chemotaxis protein
MKEEFTCFLIDDDSDDQEIFLSVMEEIGPSIRCFTAANGSEALRKLMTEEVKPDLIFVDLNMPLMNGTQFLAECTLLERFPKIPVIVLTTSSDKRTIEETLKLGAIDYITKPDRFSGWETIIREKIAAFWTPH